MSTHTHRFIDTYKGLVGFGLDRKTDENTLKYCLQKFSDDLFLDTLTERLSDEDIEEIFNLITRMLKKHLSEEEYHRLYMKDLELKADI